MTNYYKNSIEYHDALDLLEARMKLEQEETDIHEAGKHPQCNCYEFVGDNSACPVHGTYTDEDESDTSMSAQLHNAGFGSGGVL